MLILQITCSFAVDSLEALSGTCTLFTKSPNKRCVPTSWHLPAKFELTVDKHWACALSVHCWACRERMWCRVNPFAWFNRYLFNAYVTSDTQQKQLQITWIIFSLGCKIHANLLLIQEHSGLNFTIGIMRLLIRDSWTWTSFDGHGLHVKPVNIEVLSIWGVLLCLHHCTSLVPQGTYHLEKYDFVQDFEVQLYCRNHIGHLISDFLVTLTLVLLHAMILLCQGMAFSVAMNSKRNQALITLMIATNFVEMKGSSTSLYSPSSSLLPEYALYCVNPIFGLNINCLLCEFEEQSSELDEL